MKIKILICFLVCSMIISRLLAQDERFGIWSSITLQTKMKKWDFSGEAELRNSHYFSHIARMCLQLEIARSVSKPLDIGASYQLINHYDQEYNDYQLRSRGSIFAIGKQKFGRFTISVREQVQITTKDDTDRLQSDGNIDTYSISPEWMWRNKWKAKCNLPNFPLIPALCVETFFQLNNPEGNVFSKIRYTFSLEYKLTKHQQIECFGLINNKINVADAAKTSAVGIGYTYSF